MGKNVEQLDLPKKTLDFLAKQYDEWDKLIAEGKAINNSKKAILENVEAQGVNRDAFKTWAKRRRWDTDKQQAFDFSLNQCRIAVPHDEGGEGDGDQDAA